MKGHLSSVIILCVLFSRPTFVSSCFKFIKGSKPCQISSLRRCWVRFFGKIQIRIIKTRKEFCFLLLKFKMAVFQWKYYTHSVLFGSRHLWCTEKNSLLFHYPSLILAKKFWPSRDGPYFCHKLLSLSSQICSLFFRLLANIK